MSEFWLKYCFSSISSALVRDELSSMERDAAADAGRIVVSGALRGVSVVAGVGEGFMMLLWHNEMTTVDRGNLIVVKPAVGFTLPSAGVTPAPGERNREMLRTTFRSRDLLLVSL